MKKKKKLPDPQYNANQYPFGGAINAGVTGIAKALGASDKNAQLWGSAISTATGLIPGMQDNLLQAGDLTGDIGNKINNKGLQQIGKVSSALTPLTGMLMADGGTIPTKKKYKYTRMADNTSGEIEVAPEDMKYIKQYNDLVNTVKTQSPEITAKNIIKKNFKATGNIEQKAGVDAGEAKSDWVVDKPITQVTDEDLEKHSPYFYKAGLKTVKEQKDLLDNMYRILGKDIISPDYQPGLRHLLNFEEVASEVKKEETPEKEAVKKIGQQNAYSSNPVKSNDIKKTFVRDEYGRPVLVSQTPIKSTEEVKTLGRRNENQVLNPNYYGEFTNTSQGVTNAELIEDPTINDMKKKRAYGGDIPNNIYGTNIPSVFKDVENAPILNTNTGLFNTPEDKAKAEKLKYKIDNLLLYHQDPNNLKSVTIDPYNTPEQLEAAQNKLINKVFSTEKPIQYKYAAGGELTQFEGNTHDAGGVPLGNSNIEVEGGETKHENYIFSDRIKTPWNKKITFADESKKIEKKYKDMPTDPISVKTKKVEMDKLRAAQEVVKGEMMKKAQRLMGDAGMHKMPDSSMMQNSQMAFGGKIRFDGGGTFDLIENPDIYTTPAAYNPNPLGSDYNSYGLPLGRSFNGITDENYAVNQLQLMSNEDPNYLGKPGQQYYDEGLVAPINMKKNFTPEEQVSLQNLTNQLNSGAITKQQYNEALAGMGLGEGNEMNASHVNPAYRDQFNAQRNQTGIPDISSVGNNMGKSGAGTGNSGTGNGSGGFDDQLRWDEKLMPFAPVLGQAATLLGGIEKTQYHQTNPNLINLQAQRTAAEKQAAIARLTAGQNIRNVAGNSGRALSNMITSNTAVQSTLGDQLAQSWMNEQNANAGILNQAGMFNTQIKNQEIDANAQNKARYQEQAIATLANLANTYTGVNKDQRAYKSQNNFNTMAANNLGTNNYGFYIDENGVVRTKFKVV